MRDDNDDATAPSTEEDEDERQPPDVIVKLPPEPRSSSRSFGPLSARQARETGAVVSAALSFAARSAEVKAMVEATSDEGRPPRRTVPLTSGPAPSRRRAALDARVEVSVEPVERDADE